MGSTQAGGRELGLLEGGEGLHRRRGSTHPASQRERVVVGETCLAGERTCWRGHAGFMVAASGGGAVRCPAVSDEPRSGKSKNPGTQC